MYSPASWSESACRANIQRQRRKPYFITRAFYHFLDEAGCFKSQKPIHCLDICCGSGDVDSYFLKKNELLHVTGIDNSESLLNAIDLSTLASERFTAIYCDLFQLPVEVTTKAWDLAFSRSSLSWFEDPYDALSAMCMIKAKYIAISSLFYPGLIDAKTRIVEYNSDLEISVERHYNTLSMPLVENELKRFGYTSPCWQEFIIGDDLDEPLNRNSMQTYTVMKADDSRLQLSGPLLMNWWFLLAELKDE